MPAAAAVAGDRVVVHRGDGVEVAGFELSQESLVPRRIERRPAALARDLRRGIVEHGTSTRSGNLLSIEQEIPERLVDEATAVPLILESGEISVHDGHTVHGSHPNRSDRRRCGLTVRFIRPEVRQSADNSIGRRWEPVLVRGEDRFGNFELSEPPFALPASTSAPPAP